MDTQIVKVFVDGFAIKPLGNERFPWLKAQVGLNVKKLTEFMESHTDERGWVNITLKESKSGTWYAEWDNWKPEKKEEVVTENIEYNSSPF